MTLKNLITVLVLGSSSVVAASSASAAGFKLGRGHGPVISHSAPRIAVHESVRPAPERVAVRESVRPIVERPVVERPIVREDVVERPIVRDIVERPIFRSYMTPHFHQRYFGYAPIVFDASPVIIDESYAGNAFVGGVMIVQLDGAVGNLELDTLGGATFVKTVDIQYTDGTTQVVDVNHYVDGTTPALDLAANGAPIASVMIYGSGAGVSVATV